MVDPNDYYTVLGLEESATLSEIQSAHRRQARKHHPDISKGDPAMFIRVQEAYDVLRDPQRRRDFDEMRRRHRDAEMPPDIPLEPDFNGMESDYSQKEPPPPPPPPPPPSWSAEPERPMGTGARSYVAQGDIPKLSLLSRIGRMRIDLPFWKLFWSGYGLLVVAIAIYELYRYASGDRSTPWPTLGIIAKTGWSPWGDPVGNFIWNVFFAVAFAFLAAGVVVTCIVILVIFLVVVLILWALVSLAQVSPVGLAIAIGIGTIAIIVPVAATYRRLHDVGQRMIFTIILISMTLACAVGIVTVGWPAYQQEMTRQEKIGTLLQTAEQHRREGRLFAPLGSNAAESYQEALGIDPRHKAAANGLRSVLIEVLDDASRAVSVNDFRRAEGLLAQISEFGRFRSDVERRRAELYTKQIVTAIPNSWSNPVHLKKEHYFRIYCGETIVVSDGSNEVMSRRGTTVPVTARSKELRFRSQGNRTQVEVFVTTALRIRGLRNPLSRVIADGEIVVEGTESELRERAGVESPPTGPASRQETAAPPREAPAAPPHQKIPVPSRQQRQTPPRESDAPSRVAGRPWLIIRPVEGRSQAFRADVVRMNTRIVHINVRTSLAGGSEGVAVGEFYWDRRENAQHGWFDRKWPDSRGNWYLIDPDGEPPYLGFLQIEGSTEWVPMELRFER